MKSIIVTIAFFNVVKMLCHPCLKKMSWKHKFGLLSKQKSFKVDHAYYLPVPCKSFESLEQYNYHGIEINIQVDDVAKFPWYLTIA